MQRRVTQKRAMEILMTALMRHINEELANEIESH